MSRKAALGVLATLVIVAAPLTVLSSQSADARTRVASAPAPVTLTAKVVNRAGRTYYRRTVRLGSLERADVRVVRRTASSVTVESRREGPQGPRATLSLRIVPGDPDVLRQVRSVVPGQVLEGMVTGFERATPQDDPPVPVVLSAFRIGVRTTV